MGGMNRKQVTALLVMVAVIVGGVWLLGPFLAILAVVAVGGLMLGMQHSRK